MIQVKDLQFPSYFLRQEIDLDPAIVQYLLEYEVKISQIGEPDTVSFSNNTISIVQPSSLTRFLFVLLYNLLKKHTSEGYLQDKLSLGLLYECKDYTYVEYDVYKKEEGSPILISFDKLHVPSTIIKEIIQPIVGHLKTLPVFFLHSTFVDACEIIETQQEFSTKFKLPTKCVSPHDCPFIVANASLFNEAAIDSHITQKILEYNLGAEKTSKIIKNIVLGDMEFNLVEVLKILNGNPIFVMDFLKFFENIGTYDRKEELILNENRYNAVATDKYLYEKLKTAQKYTPQVFKQWEQWSMIMGLIEKQLEPMRGSMWPTTELVKPFEDQHRRIEREEAERKGKTQLNFEELLELSRSWYNHKAVQPGQLYETLLRENRIWKT